MIDLIISSGTSGCESEALRIAKKYKINTFGYTGLTLDNGKIPEHLKSYRLEGVGEKENADFKNIEISDGVLWVSENEIPSDEYLELKNFGLKNGVKFFRILKSEQEIYEKAEKIRDWIFENGITALMVHCFSENKGSGEKKFISNLMESLIYMVLMKTDPSSLASPIHVKAPDMTSKSESVKSVVEDLVKTIPLKDKVLIANMMKEDLYDVFSSLGISILSKYYWPANNHLKNDCIRVLGKKDPEDYDIAEVIIVKLWESLKETHTLRVV